MMTNASQSRFRLAVLLAGFALLALCLFGQALFRRDIVMGWPGFNDVVRQFAFFHAYYQRTLAGGEWPLWNPYVVAGMPAAMFGQTGLFYPLNWLTLAAPSYDAIDAQLALHFLLAQAVTYWISRRLGLSVLGAVVSALCYAMSGAMGGRIHEGHLTIFQALAWFPLAWGSLYRLLGRDRDGKDWAAAVGGFTMMGLAGAPQIWLYALIVAAITAVARVAVEMACKAGPKVGHSRREGLIEGRRIGHISHMGPIVFVPLLRAAAVLALAIGLCAAEWAPVAASGRDSARAQLAPEYPESRLDFPIEQTLTLAFPFFFGDMAHTEYWGRGIFGEAAAGIGALTLALALLFGFSFSDRTLTWTAAVVGGLCLLLAFGWQLGRFGPYAILKFLVPPMRMVNGSTRFLFAVSWALSLCSGAGVDGLRRRLEESPRFARVAAARLGVAALAAGAVAASLTVAGWGAWGLPQTVFAAARPAAELGLLAGALWWFYIRKIPSAAIPALVAAIALFDAASTQGRRFSHGPAVSHPELTEKIGGILKKDARGGRVLGIAFDCANVSMAAGYEDVNGYTVTMPADFARAAAWTSGREARAEHRAVFNRLTDPFCSWFAVNYAVTSAGDRCDPERWMRVWAGEKFALWRSKREWPRVQICHGARSVTRLQAEGLARSGYFPPEHELFVEDAPSDLSDLSDPSDPSDQNPSDSVKEIARTTNRREWNARLSAPGWLLIHETWQPGWRARVDGKDARLTRAQYCLCALPLSAGEHHIEMAYRPAFLTCGLVMSATTALALLVFILSRRGKVWSRGLRSGEWGRGAMEK